MTRLLKSALIAAGVLTATLLSSTNSAEAAVIRRGAVAGPHRAAVGGAVRTPFGTAYRGVVSGPHGTAVVRGRVAAPLPPPAFHGAAVVHRAPAYYAPAYYAPVYYAPPPPPPVVRGGVVYWGY